MPNTAPRSKFWSRFHHSSFCPPCTAHERHPLSRPRVVAFWTCRRQRAASRRLSIRRRLQQYTLLWSSCHHLVCLFSCALDSRLLLHGYFSYFALCLLACSNDDNVFCPSAIALPLFACLCLAATTSTSISCIRSFSATRWVQSTLVLLLGRESCWGREASEP